MSRLLAQVNELEILISKHEILNNDISKSNVGWHIEHTLLTINLIIEQLKKSDPAKYKWRFNIPKIIVFTLNKIPRGRARSPKVVVPKSYSIVTLQEHIIITRNSIKELQALPSDKYFTHPYFGDLKLTHTLKFLEIHTSHHLEIINDIVK